MAILGAGPYGLAAAAHLHAANGLSICVLGKPMSFWEQQMPKGMLLRSPYVASNIADPERALTLDGFQAGTHQHLTPPVGLDRFVEYGRWFQQQAFPRLDPRQVARIDKDDAFRLEFTDGDRLRAKRVVVAAGILPFAWKPPQFRDLPDELASHTSAHRDLARFAGKQVFVVGGGQSALESAALLREAEAQVEVLVRAPRIYFLRRGRGVLHRLGPDYRPAVCSRRGGPGRSLEGRLNARLVPADAACSAGSLRGALAATRRCRLATAAARGRFDFGLYAVSRRRARRVDGWS